MGYLGYFSEDFFDVCLYSARVRDFEAFQRAGSEHFQRSNSAEKMIGTFLVVF